MFNLDLRSLAILVTTAVLGTACQADCSVTYGDGSPMPGCSVSKADAPDNNEDDLTGSGNFDPDDQNDNQNDDEIIDDPSDTGDGTPVDPPDTPPNSWESPFRDGDYGRRINWSAAVTTPGNWQQGISAIDVDMITLIVATSQDPIVEFRAPENGRCDAGGRYQGSYHLPQQLVDSPLYRNGIAVILQPDGHFFEVSYFDSACDDGNGGTFAGGWVLPGQSDQSVKPFIHQSNAFGWAGGHGGSHVTALGGVLRLGELTGPDPINHVLNVEVDGSHLFCSPDPSGGIDPDGGHVWPAIDNDWWGCRESSFSPTYTGSNPAVKMGALLALPPSFDCDDLVTVPGFKICEAMKTYGGVIVDNNDVPNAVSFPLEHDGITGDNLLQVYDGANVNGDLESDIDAMWREIVVVTNPSEPGVWPVP